jgi:hypothetical protein
VAAKDRQGGELMEFEVYCDEARQDLFTSRKPVVRYLMIGSLWLPASFRNDAKAKIGDIRAKHSAWGEIKWSKISPGRLPFYMDIVDLFVSYGLDVRFRCIAVDNNVIDMELHGNDQELGFYKFYYQMLHHWILDFNRYRIFCDAKTNRDPKRLQVLKSCLHCANLSSRIESVQSLPSGEVVLIQLCDLLLGAASSRMNETLKAGSARETVAKRLEAQLGVEKLGPTYRSESKFNVFHIRLQGGW